MTRIMDCLFPGQLDRHRQHRPMSAFGRSLLNQHGILTTGCCIGKLQRRFYQGGERISQWPLLPWQLPVVEDLDNNSGEVEANDTSYLDHLPSITRMPASTSAIAPSSARGYELPLARA